METVNCDLCGSERSNHFLQRADRLTDEIFTYVRCVNCGLIYLNPRPTLNEISHYYPSSYEAYHISLEQLSRWKKVRRQHGLDIQLKFVEKYKKTGRLLDIGCATGDFIAYAQKRGWQTTGVELNERAAAIAREERALNVYTGPLHLAPLSPNTFDVITLWDVFEHLHHPTIDLGRIVHLLRPRGMLIMSIPNLKSFDRFLFGHNWIGWDAPRHLYLFDEEKTSHILLETGFQVIDTRCILGGPGAFRLSLGFYLCQLPRGQRLFKSISPLLPWLLWPYKKIAYALNRGPVITVVAQKR